MVITASDRRRLRQVTDIRLLTVGRETA